jgi:hypothetical protein
MENKIINLLEDTVETLTSIIDTVTPADGEYVEDKIISALKDVALGAFPPNYCYVGSRILGEPFFQSINTAIASLSSFGIIKILEQLSDENMTVTAGSDILLEGIEKTKFYILADEIEDGIYKNLTIKYVTGEEITNSKFENCDFIEVLGTAGLLKLNSCEINNCNLDCAGGEINLINCSGFNNKYTSSTIEVGVFGNLLLNIFNEIGTIDFSFNSTNDLNIIIERNPN